MPHDHSKIYDGVPYVHPGKPVITVKPINSVPYLGPPLVPANPPFPAAKKNNDGPALVLLPTCPTEEETKDILSSSKGVVILTGSAALGKMGPMVGSVDIGESKDEYIFRVSLPGVFTDRYQFKWGITPNGKVVIKGVTTTGEGIVRKFSEVFEMQTQNLCPPGEFQVSFTLPGPIDHQKFSGSFFHDGILLGKINKKVV